MTKTLREIYISVDIEASGPNPSTYSMLSIGACTVFGPEKSFYVEIQPVNDNFTPEALEVCQLDLEKLQDTGLPPKEAMTRFAEWVDAVVPKNSRPVFVAVNAPFDWMFVNDYFHRFLGHNPFGHNAIGMKAFYMGLSHCSWNETGMAHLSELYLEGKTLTHNALQDALDQAEIFRELLAEQPATCGLC